MDSILVKAKWAHDHIDDLDLACSEFFDQKPCPCLIGTEHNPETHQVIYQFHGCSPLSRNITGHVGDILYNLRSTLDHLAWQLVIANGNKPGTRTGFPIYDPTSKDAESSFSGKVKGMRDETVKAIRRLKPHKGGNDTLWLLHELNRIDKHHQFLGIGLAHIGSEATERQRTALEKMWKEANPNATGTIPPGIALTFPTLKILETGDILQITSEPEDYPNRHFTFQVSFDVPGVVGVKPIIETLQEMERVVVRIVCDFRTKGHFRIGP